MGINWRADLYYLCGRDGKCRGDIYKSKNIDLYIWARQTVAVRVFDEIGPENAT